MPVHLDLNCVGGLKAPNKTSNVATRKTLNALSLAIAKSRRVVVVTGAGISCSSGIPDFRSSDGLYALVKSRYPNVVLKGKDLFSASLFREAESTRLFYTFIAELKSKIDKAHPSPTHRFIKTLDAKGKLLRCYTQNIDGFEERVGIQGPVVAKSKTKRLNAKDSKNIQLHGDIHAVRCVICNAVFPCIPAYIETFLEGSPPDCPECSARSDARLARNARPLTVGILRPAIVLYDEAHPLGEEIGTICSADMSKRPDIIVIMGTSLKVHGIKNLVRGFANAVHDKPKDVDAVSLPVKTEPGNLLVAKNPKLVIFVNRTPPPADLAHLIDYWVEGDTDIWVQKCEADWRAARPQDWEVQSKLVGADREGKSMPLSEAKNTFQVVKGPSTATSKGKVSHSTKSPGSENALPSSNTLSIVIPLTVPKVAPLPKIKPSALRPAHSPVSIPTPPPPKLPAPRIPVQHSHIEPGDGLAHASDPVEAAPVVAGPAPPSPKKTRLADGRAKPIAAPESEEEPLTRATLFGTRVKGQDMSLDAIVVHDAPSSKTGISVARGSANTKAKIQRSVARRPRADHDMSVDDIHVAKISSDDDEPSSSQVALVSEHTTRRATTRRKDAGVSSPQDTHTLAELPQRSRAIVSTGAKKPLAGGIAKGRKTRLLPKAAKPLSSSGATVLFGALTVNS